MYTQGMTFGTDGPVMSGTWYHPTTGDKFTVADTFFEDNQLLVRTTDGRLLNYNIIQNYIQQSSTSSNDVEPHANANYIQTKTGLPQEVMDLIETPSLNEPGWSPALSEPIGNLYNPAGTEQAQLHIGNHHIVSKALSKTELPELKVELVWNKYPEREIEMLKDIMDVSVEDIIKWYVDKFDLNTIKTQISDSIHKTLNKAHIQEISTKDDTLLNPDLDLSNKPRKTSKKTK